MIIAGVYSFNGGKEAFDSKYAAELQEIKDILALIDSTAHKTKKSREKTMPDRMLYNPKSLNKAIAVEFKARSWKKHKEYCEYSSDYYAPALQPSTTVKKRKQRPYREMDFVRGHVGVEVQFGKYAFMVYNVCAKMTIFNKLGLIDVGVEIVPVKAFADEMSTGVSYFEQFVWDLEHRGVSDIDIPVLILGIAA